ncbi:methylated-DNA--[protein]-cysteine S-methyltransferase [Acidithiobacillus sp.]
MDSSPRFTAPLRALNALRRYHSPLGPLVLDVAHDRVFDLAYGDRPELPPLAGIVREVLDAYFAADPAYFSLLPQITLAPQGTPFQQQVWRMLLRIPWGQTQTYGALAAVLPSAAQAVGQACKANPIAVLIPCHRVVAVSGLGGYGGARGGMGWERKGWLLRHEGALV